MHAQVHKICTLLGTSSQDHDNYDKTQPLAGEDAWEIDS